MTVSIWIKFTEWLTTLDKKKIIVVLVCVIVTYLLFENHNLREENVRLNSRVIIVSDRCDSIKNIYEQKFQQCNDKRIHDLEKNNLFWSDKFEKLEEKFYKHYEPIRQVR